MRVIRAISAILALAGLLTLGFALERYRTQARFVENADAAIGEVTQLTRRSSTGVRNRTSTYYTFRVAFRTPGGESVEEEAMESSTSPRFSEGEKVPVLFARVRPRDFNIDEFAMLWADVVVLFIIGGSLLGAGSSAFWIAGGRSQRKARTEANLAEVARAWREGRLTRDSEFQGLLVGFALAGFPLLGATLLFVLFAPWPVQLIVGAILAYIAIQVIRDRRAAKGAATRAPPRR